MGKPRMIILIRHAQSEGNKNREIHQLIPDHRVKLTEDGWNQAEEAGRRLRGLLRPDDTLQFYTSPYRRTRETTEGILRTLTSPDDDSGAPSPFSRNQIKIYEEPRIREQDFGNFQPCSAEMERMWQERADYGHFFYRIPNGESAADAYDRISGFNESLWRSFGEEDFPSVCVLVTHGLMSRVFLMKWYHWSVEYFEDLRNVNHCEFVEMKKDLDNGKYILQSQLRTWSELKRQRAEEAAKNVSNAAATYPQRRNTLSQFLPHTQKAHTAPPPKKWGGCVGGCNHNHERFPRRKMSKTTQEPSAPSTTDAAPAPASNEGEDHPVANQFPITQDGTTATPPVDGSVDSELSETPSESPNAPRFSLPFRPASGSLLPGRDGGGTPGEGLSEGDDYFDPNGLRSAHASSTAAGTGNKASAPRKIPKRKTTQEDLERWATESGMGEGRRADALGDEPDENDEHESDEAVDAGDEVGSHADASQARMDDLEAAEAEDKSLRGSVY